MVRRRNLCSRRGLMPASFLVAAVSAAEGNKPGLDEGDGVSFKFERRLRSSIRAHLSVVEGCDRRINRRDSCCPSSERQLGGFGRQSADTGHSRRCLLRCGVTSRIPFCSSSATWCAVNLNPCPSGTRSAKMGYFGLRGAMPMSRKVCRPVLAIRNSSPHLNSTFRLYSGPCPVV